MALHLDESLRCMQQSVKTHQLLVHATHDAGTGSPHVISAHTGVPVIVLPVPASAQRARWLVSLATWAERRLRAIPVLTTRPQVAYEHTCVMTGMNIF